jgi:hypothetical protein
MIQRAARQLRLIALFIRRLARYILELRSRGHENKTGYRNFDIRRLAVRFKLASDGPDFYFLFVNYDVVSPI